MTTNLSEPDGAVIVAHRISAHATPLGEWLAEVADRVVLVTSTRAADGYAGVFPEVIGVPDYSDGDGVAEQVDRLCRTRRVGRIVHGTEDDILRLATIRDRHGIPGLGEADALRYRDKLLMKQAVAGTVRTPAFWAPAPAEDMEAGALAFAGEAGWPVVVKPRLGYGAHGVSIVATPEELRAELDGRPVDDVLVEEYIPGAVFHIDGFMRDGKVLATCPSRYLNDCLAWRDGTVLGSIQLDPADPLAAALNRLTEDALGALPATSLSLFHLEIIEHERTGDLYFCETAARVGGARTVDALTSAFAFNPMRLWFRDQAGIADACPDFRVGDLRTGFLLIPPRPGTLRAIRGTPPPEGLRGFDLKATIPARFTDAFHAHESVLEFIVDGHTSAQVQARIEACMLWASTAMRWEEE